MERSVDVTYRGLRVAKGARLVDAPGGEQGFVELEAPLPVGTRVTLVGEGDFRVEARVVAVTEQDGSASANRAPAGMRLDWAVPKVAEAATTMELDPETDAIDDAGTSGGMPVIEEAEAAEGSTSTAPAGESRAGRRRRKRNQNGRP